MHLMVSEPPPSSSNPSTAFSSSNKKENPQRLANIGAVFTKTGSAIKG
jgi:hypothetical protein